ncbi:MAG: putative colanic acid biosynthesis acetyltransferase WcaF, partial [Verrucomicrobiota bacterium]
ASVHNSARIDCPWNLEMGERASVGEDAWVYALDKVVINDEACVGQRVFLLTGTHDFQDPTFPLVTRPIVVGYGCWVAVGAIVLPGVKIGSLSVVGAGSVVTRDLPEQMVCAGNPCRPIKRREFKQPLDAAA